MKLILRILLIGVLYSCAVDDTEEKSVFSEEDLTDCQIETVNGTKLTSLEFLVSNAIIVDGETKSQKLYFKVDDMNEYTLRFFTELNTNKNVYAGLVEPLDTAELLFAIEFSDGILPYRGKVSQVRRIEPENFINDDTIVSYEFVISKIPESQIQRFLKTKVERIVFSDFNNFLPEEKVFEIAKQMTCLSQ